MKNKKKVCVCVCVENLLFKKLMQQKWQYMYLQQSSYMYHVDFLKFFKPQPQNQLWGPLYTYIFMYFQGLTIGSRRNTKFSIESNKKHLQKSQLFLKICDITMHMLLSQYAYIKLVGVHFFFTLCTTFILPCAVKIYIKCSERDTRSRLNTVLWVSNVVGQ